MLTVPYVYLGHIEFANLADSVNEESVMWHYLYSHCRVTPLSQRMGLEKERDLVCVSVYTHACRFWCGPQDMWPSLQIPCLVLQSPLGSVRGYLPVWWLNPELSPSVSHVRCMLFVCCSVCFLHCLEGFTIGRFDKQLTVGSSGGWNLRQCLVSVT